MGCGSSSPKPVKQNKKTPTTSSTAATTATGPNASKVDNQGETSNSQINVQIDPNNPQNDTQGGQNGTEGKAVGGTDNLKSVDQNNPDGEQIAENSPSRSPEKQSASNSQAGNPPSHSSKGRANTTQGFASRNSQQPGTASSKSYPSPGTNGQFENSRAKTIPGRGRQQEQQRLSDELLNDPAYRRKVLAETSERLKTKESQSPRGGKERNSPDDQDEDIGNKGDDNEQNNQNDNGDMSNRSDQYGQGSSGNPTQKDETGVTGIIWDSDGKPVGLITDSMEDTQMISKTSRETTRTGDVVQTPLRQQDFFGNISTTTVVHNTEETSSENESVDNEILPENLDSGSIASASESTDISGPQPGSSERISPRRPMRLNYEQLEGPANQKPEIKVIITDCEFDGFIPQMGIVKELTRDIITTKNEQKTQSELRIEKVMTTSADVTKENFAPDTENPKTTTGPPFLHMRELTVDLSQTMKKEDLTDPGGEKRVSNSTDTDKEVTPDTRDLEIGERSGSNKEDNTKDSALREYTFCSDGASYLPETDEDETASDGEDDDNDSGKPVDDRLENTDGLNTASIDAGIQLSYSPEYQRSSLDREDSPERKRKAKQQQYVPYYGDPNERAKAKRIRFMLREAMIRNDLEELDEAIWLFETNEITDLGDLTEAINRLEILQLKKDLKEAIERRNLGILNRAIGDTYSTKHDKDLRHLLNRAEELRDHLEALNHYTHDILHLDHNLISEIRSYCNPPPSVHEVMAACYMLLGVREERLLEWAEVQAHVGRTGRTGLKNMIQSFDPDRVPVQTVLRVKEILNFYNLEDVRVASNGAASFYIWAKNMVDMVDKRRLQNAKDDQERAKSSAKKG